MRISSRILPNYTFDPATADSPLLHTDVSRDDSEEYEQIETQAKLAEEQSKITSKFPSSIYLHDPFGQIILDYCSILAYILIKRFKTPSTSE
ncbi:unnamed protein product [Adineta steineri]|uniref:Uncharacterized protein n=1 Tax=Adineta steineri TaxID=433720 RepID=A0A814D074_9BILA|nr:unnamed protein product [Adineta steineri]CAF3687420.1 unnamed protein product [Adineta steineri]